MKNATKLLATLILLSVVLQPACSSSSKYEPSGNPLLDLRNPELLERDRITAAKAAWSEVEQGIRNRDRTRYALKNLAWSGATERDLRLVVLDLLLSDASEEGNADSRSMARLILPNEREPEAVRIIARHAVDFGWDDLIPAFVRSLSRQNAELTDRQRPEYVAIQQLSGSDSIERVVFDVFLNPSRGLGSEQERAVLRTSERTRDDAWGLLSRLDPTGDIREQFLRDAVNKTDSIEAGSRELVLDLQAAGTELGVLPDTSMEIAWLRSLRHHDDPRDNEQNNEWWAQARRAVQALSPEQRIGMRMRHLEPIRWANENRSTWLDLDREAMFGLLSSRLRGRVVHKRKSEKGEPPRQERLGDWSELLTWGDLLSILVVDDAIASAAVQEQMFKQRELDKKDTSTEYGGIIEPDQNTRWRAVLFRPRQRDRVSDRRFVASDDMFRFSDRSLAHYHFHANDRNNSQYAGPSLQDLQNAVNSQRTSVVLTSMGSDELNVDVYFGLGIVVDLGVIERQE